jgi:hypothetical protein
MIEPPGCIFPCGCIVTTIAFERQLLFVNVVMTPSAFWRKTKISARQIFKRDICHGFSGYMGGLMALATGCLRVFARETEASRIVIVFRLEIRPSDQFKVFSVMIGMAFSTAALGFIASDR